MRSVVTMIISIIIIFMVGLIVIGQLVNSASNMFEEGSEAKQTWDALVGNIWTVFGILVIIPLIVGAVAIMHLLGIGAPAGAPEV